MDKRSIESNPDINRSMDDTNRDIDSSIGQSSESQTNVSVGEHTASADPNSISADTTSISDITPPASQTDAHIAAGEPTTGGDTFSNQGQAKVVGEEAVGGTTPTPGQNVVGEVADAAGISYRDRQPVAGVEEMNQRDDARWELDPKSSEDYREHKP